jgi:hypothetical protein
MIWSFCSQYYSWSRYNWCYIYYIWQFYNTLLKHGKFDINLIFIEAVHVWCLYKVRSNIYNFNINILLWKAHLKNTTRMHHSVNIWATLTPFTLPFTVDRKIAWQNSWNYLRTLNILRHCSTHVTPSGARYKGYEDATNINQMRCFTASKREALIPYQERKICAIFLKR